MKKKIFCALLALMLLLSGCSSGAGRNTTPGTPDEPAQGTTSEPAAEWVALGECGDNVSWVLDSNGVLTVKGTGAMSYRHAAPWRDHYESIKAVVIGDGVTSIAEGAFSGCINLTSVTISDSVTRIRKQAFEGCTNLKSVTFGNSVEYIEWSAFHSCDSLTSVTLPASVTEISAFAFSVCSKLTDIYYKGSEEQWEGISNNDYLDSIVIHYNS